MLTRLLQIKIQSNRTSHTYVSQTAATTITLQPNISIHSIAQAAVLNFFPSSSIDHYLVTSHGQYEN